MAVDSALARTVQYNRPEMSTICTGGSRMAIKVASCSSGIKDISWKYEGVYEVIAVGGDEGCMRRVTTVKALLF